LTRRAIVTAGDTSALDRVPRDVPVVLDFGDRACDMTLIGQCAERRLRVERVLVRTKSLGDVRIEAFLEQPVDTLVVLEQSATIREAIAAARGLVRPSLQIELPLETEDDLNVIKILSSLGVRTRIAVSRLAGDAELLGDLLTDAVLPAARRAPVTPFAEIVEHLDADGFELAQLDYRANEHHVDLREADVEPPEDWQSPDVLQRRVPFLLDRHACAFCEGLCFCHGYLLDQGQAQRCAAFWSELSPVVALRAAREEARSEQQPQPGPGDGRPNRRAGGPGGPGPRRRAGPPGAPGQNRRGSGPGAPGPNRVTRSAPAKNAPGADRPQRRALPIAPDAPPVGPEKPC
jgi:hypothetical protein